MKKTIATLIAGLFATAAFAQTPAPATSKTSKPAAKQAVLVNNADLKASNADTKATPGAAPAAQADTNVMPDATQAAKPHAKAVKMSAKHAKSKTKHVAKTEAVKEDQNTA